MSTLTLAEKVWNVALDDSPSGVDRAGETMLRGPIAEVDPDWPSSADEEVFDGIDCANWGYIYGVALGIARGEDVFESLESVAARALDAARDAWVVYTHGKRPPGQTVTP